MERIGQFYDQLWNNMDLSSSGQVLWYFRDAFAVIVLGYTVHWLPQSLKDKIEEAYYQSPIWVKALIMAVVAVICYQTFSNDAPAFIYFQF